MTIVHKILVWLAPLTLLSLVFFGVAVGSAWPAWVVALIGVFALANTFLMGAFAAMKHDAIEEPGE